MPSSSAASWPTASGDVICPRRPDFFHLKFWPCAPCNAYVGCHPPGNGDGTKPLGRLADEELRRLKKAWRRLLLAEQATGIPLKRCHVGMMNGTECELVRCTIMEAELDGTLPVKLLAPQGEATANVMDECVRKEAGAPVGIPSTHKAPARVNP
ncbi:hypothetical protein J2W49_004808 [Hydrogenophaga palleronii]|uniref:Uncharacterized protein n=1 Tax=Hydrogenophaga palleronii TaxID=65655 RepID=A0ABU1WU49_9BURK|nr:hypothetical protein [Hydrogenophaga palleronii]